MRSRCYPSDLTDAQWALVGPHIPSAKFGGRPRTTDVRAVLDAIIDLLRTGCQWRQLSSDFPPWPTAHGYFRGWRMSGVWALLHRALYPLARLAAGRKPDPTVVIMDGQSVKTVLSVFAPLSSAGFDHRRQDSSCCQDSEDNRGFPHVPPRPHSGGNMLPHSGSAS
jgi:transposase